MIAAGFLLLIPLTVIAFEDNSIRALSLEIAAGAVFVGGCALAAGKKTS